MLHPRRSPPSSRMPIPSKSAPLDHRYRIEAGGCPIEASLDVLSGRWKGLLLFRICHRPRRFSELFKSLPQVSQRMLARQLRELEASRLIRRTVSVPEGKPAQVQYTATEAGIALSPLLNQLRDWGARYLLNLPGQAVSARSRSYQNGVPLRGARKLQACR